MQTTYFDIKPAPTTPLEVCERRRNHVVARLISKLGKKIRVNEPYYISKTCYFAGMTLVHPDDCVCDQEYESFKEAFKGV